MEMLINTIEHFIICIPTAAGSEWSAIEPHLETAQMELTMNLLGIDLNAVLLAFPEPTGARLVANKLLAVSAYRNAIPFVDLKQTENGFAVVSNNNLAPASKERVERLISWCELHVDGLTDLLIKQILADATLRTEWAKFSEFEDIVNCFFVTGTEFSSYTNSKESLRRSNFLQHKFELVIWQENIISPIISKNYLMQLIEEIRTQTFSPGSASIIHFCKMLLSALMLKEQRQAESLLEKISNMLENNLEKYSAYANSDEYMLKHAARDMNKADHPTFFMGI